MCTVTYLPLKNEGFILTSNRDESPIRKTFHPEKYLENDIELIYPKDELAGGTWIGCSDKKRLVCLLNGGFEKHQRNSYYKMSRGVVVKNILSVDNPIKYIKEFDFKNIEPFTLILVDWSSELHTYELVWDEKSIHFKELKQLPKIWSSSSLYDAEMKALRELWFKDWLVDNSKFNQDTILAFHQNSDKGAKETALKMKRFFVETVSVTSVQKKSNEVSMNYLDLRTQKKSTIVI